MGQWTCKSETISELGDEISREREERIKEILGNVKYNPLFDSVPLHETVAQPSFLERLDWRGKGDIRKGDNPREIYRRSLSSSDDRVLRKVAIDLIYYG